MQAAVARQVDRNIVFTPMAAACNCELFAYNGCDSPAQRFAIARQNVIPVRMPKIASSRSFTDGLFGFRTPPPGENTY